VVVILCEGPAPADEAVTHLWIVISLTTIALALACSFETRMTTPHTIAGIGNLAPLVHIHILIDQVRWHKLLKESKVNDFTFDVWKLGKPISFVVVDPTPYHSDDTLETVV
jgi:hypothetical protein